MTTKKMRASNDGAERLQKTGLSLAAIVDALAKQSVTIARATASRWRAGVKVPALDARKALEAALGIPAKAWELRPGALGEQTKGADVVDITRTAAEKAEDLLTRIERWRGEAEFEGTSAAARAQLGALELKAIEQLAKLTGQSAPPESTLLKSPHWTKLYLELLEVLEAHPDALRAVVKIIDRKGKDG